VEFEKIKSDDKVEDIILGALELKLPVTGGWGYTKDDPVIITDDSMPSIQLEYMFVTAHSTIVMNLTQPKEKRYGGINVKELSRESLEEKGEMIEKVNFEISGMLEDVYADFIKEYKENHGDDKFDLNGHFKRREENTLKLNQSFWFKKKGK
jgi:hypothetical protein